MMADSFSPPSSPLRPSGAGVRTPFLIGVAGGTASGKTTVCRSIMKELGQYEPQVVMISQDSFYKVLSAEQREAADAGEYNFDHPDAFDDKLITRTLEGILKGKVVDIPVYDFKTHSRLAEARRVQPVDVVLFEGILVLYYPALRDLLHMKLFVDTDSDTRLARRVLRDTQERGRQLEQVLDQYTNFVKPAFEEFTLPTKKYADVIIPRGAENMVAISLIVQHIKEILAGNISNRRAPHKKIRRQSDSLLARPH